MAFVTAALREGTEVTLQARQFSWRSDEPLDAGGTDLGRNYGYPRYFGYGGGGMLTRDYVREYVQGTLILDIIDGGKNELIWRGLASKALAHEPKPEKVDEYVFEAVGKILEGFPPEV